MLRSLRAKLVLTYAGLTLLVVGALALYTISSLEDLLLKSLADDLGAQARLVADQASENLAAGRLDAVHDLLARVDATTDARAIAVDSRRRIVGASELEERSQLGTTREEEGIREALRGETTSKTLPRTPNGEVLYVATPIRHDGQIVGAVRLAYHLQDVEGTLRNLNLTVLVGALGAVLLSALISLGFARAIADPVRELSRAAHALSGGDLHQHLVSHSSDEVGELVQSFNAMASKLRDAETARREFASDVSHELHSLAASMQTAAEALERGAARDDRLRSRLVDGLVGHTRRLNRLSEDLLQLARLEAGRLTLSLQPCSLADVARSTIDEFAAEAHQRELALALTVNDELPTVADEVRLIQAVGNLVENAVKYTPPGGRVEVSAAASNGEYVITVADSGHGIPPEELPHIWDRYYRVEGRASAGSTGTGLGLAIAAGIVNAHGGWIDAQSALDEGTVFKIHLPKRPSE